jgi:nicotinamidase-related amidase
MSEKRNGKRPLIVGKPALIMVDFQRGGAYAPGSENGIVHKMGGAIERRGLAKTLVAAARANGVPVIFIQEVHRPDLVDFGRELDGEEDVHCLEGRRSTEIAAEDVDYRPGDYHIPKRRYSAFYGTDFEILLKGLKVQTLVLAGGLTDVCVHYTFVDGHQGDYYCRVIEDCAGGSSREAHEAALRAMEYLQSGARRRSEEIIAAFTAYGAATT